MKNNGFSITELTIVLVILGLISVVISSGTKLIKAARVRGIIMHLTTYEESVFLFKQTYGFLPGNFPNTNVWLIEEVQGKCHTVETNGSIGKIPNVQFIAGSGNGLINRSDRNFPIEIDLVTCHMVLGGVLPIRNAGTGIFKDRNYHVLLNKENSSGYYIDKYNSLTLTSKEYDFDPKRSVIEIDDVHIILKGSRKERTGISYANGGIYTHVVLPLSLLMAIDFKIDDGMPGTGKVLFGNDNDRCFLFNNNFEICKNICLGEYICSSNKRFPISDLERKNATYMLYVPKSLY